MKIDTATILLTMWISAITGETQMNIGNALREIRSELGHSQAKLAWMIGVTPGAISLIESNNRTPSIAMMKRICNALRTTVSDFFYIAESIDE